MTGSKKITIEIPFGDAIKDFRKSKTAKHLRGIQREFLLTVRSLLDRRISALSEEESTAEAAPEADAKADA